ncbi:MAG: fatty acid desaturase [Hahellaceae bacterium]|nr:fatty acid desaturase [Hahellaceae bacterium]MCP5169925.1 fatty acid desaturase [Hahellaceae bacterium]
MKKPPIIWLNVTVFSLTSLFALIGVPWYGVVFGYDIWHVVATVLCIGYCGMSITAGYHRLWAHHAYETNKFVRIVLALGGAFALQNSALHWSSDHRVHHKHVDDNDKDPYSAKKGFWYSHMGWMLREYQASRYTDYSNVPDLQRDPVVMWQHKHYLALTIITNFGIPLLIGIIHGDVIGMCLTAGFLRLVISHHVTFFINSWAHMWGAQPYSDQNTAKDNALLAYFTFGEGYHNYHHCFQFDYRNGIRWWHFDPTKWFIYGMSKVGMATNLRRVREDRIERARAEMTLKRAQGRVQLLPNAEEMLHKLQLEYENFVTQLNEYYEAKKQWFEVKRDEVIASYEKSEAMQRYKDLKAQLAEQRERWHTFTAQYA